MIIEAAKRSIIQIKTGDDGGATGLIWIPDGLVVTNAHVVRDRKPEVILPDGRIFKGRILYQNRSHDLAVLSIDVGALSPIALGDSDLLETGQFVVAIGHAWGDQEYGNGRYHNELKEQLLACKILRTHSYRQFAAEAREFERTVNRYGRATGRNKHHDIGNGYRIRHRGERGQGFPGKQLYLDFACISRFIG